VTNPDDQRPGARPNPGYYGAGWSGGSNGQPQQPRIPQAAPGAGYGWVPPRPERRPASPTAPFAPGASGPTSVAAAIAVGGVAAVLLVQQVVWVIGAATATGPYGYGGALGRVFLGAWLLSPLAWYVGTFLVLAFLAPIGRRSPLPTVLLRAVLGGAGGTIALVVVGLFAGFAQAIRVNQWGLVLSAAVTGPISSGIGYTALLLGAATAAWLWMGRPARRRGPAAPGMPGTVPPADAVPPATVPQQQAQQQQPQQQPPQQQQWAPPQQAPQEQWAPPASQGPVPPVPPHQPGGASQSAPPSQYPGY
jgi:hypothetical protein